MNDPKISVIIPLYNHEKYINEAVYSVLGQTFSDFELIIINDGSNDGSEEVVKKIKDKRIKYYYQENKGAHNTINRGIEIAKGEYIAILNSDDMYHKDVTDEMMSVSVLDGEEPYRYVQYTHGYVYKPRNRKLKRWWRKHNTPPFFAMVYSRDTWDNKINNSDGELFDGGHEQVKNHKRKLLGEGKFCVGVHDLNMVTTIGKREEIINEEEKRLILKDFGVDYPEPDFIKANVHDLFGLVPGGWEKTKDE